NGEGDVVVGVAAAAPGVQGHAQARLDRAVAAAAGAVPAVAPVRQPGGDLDLLPIQVVLHRAQRPGRGVGQVRRQVAQPDVNRIQVQPGGHAIDGRPCQVAVLRVTGGTHGPGRAGVETHDTDTPFDVPHGLRIEDVRIGQQVEIDRGAAGVTGRAVDVHLEGLNGAVGGAG